MKLHKLIFFILGLSFTGCNYGILYGAPKKLNEKFSLPENQVSTLSYGVIAAKVFNTRCVSCHGTSGNINLESYPEVVKNIDLIRRSVFETKTMPKKESLTQEELSFLWNWIQIGAPEQAPNGSTPPPVEVEPMTATYESINKHVLQVSCKDCHNPTGTGKRIPLDLKSLLDSPLELIIPGNPDESGLILALERADDKRMPPADEGYSALNDETIALIRKWIENGAKD